MALVMLRGLFKEEARARLRACHFARKRRRCPRSKRPMTDSDEREEIIGKGLIGDAVAG